MASCPIPENEVQRLQALRAFDILDTPPEEAFDQLTRLLATFMETPFALVSLIDESRQWFKSRHGIEVEETPRDLAFCAHAIMADELFIIPDALDDERFADNPLVTGAPNIRFYAGAPLVDRAGFRLGTLCAIDSVPRQISERQKLMLTTLSRLVVDQLELRAGTRRLRQQADELVTAKQEAERASQAKSEFLSSMSHELRTPMNAIFGFAQMLDFNPKEPLSRTQKQCVDHITAGSQHLLNLINDVLELAKIEAGKIDLAIGNVSVRRIIEDCLPMVSAMAAELDIKITPPVDVPVHDLVRADPTRLKQAILNLLSNAIKYNSLGGSVSIGVAATDDNRIRISVADTGIGIAASKQEELFQPFNRLGAEASDVEGSGIGLTVTKRLVDLMGGKIEFDSIDNQGSTFQIEIPMAAPGAVEGQTLSPPGASRGLAGATGTLLYVEDNPANLELTKMIVSHIDGLTMLSAHTAEFGLALARDHAPDVIILDINLPGMNGLEALAKLRRTAATAKTPIIALSAAATDADIAAGMSAGFDNYLTKPMRVEEIANVIKAAVERSA